MTSKRGPRHSIYFVGRHDKPITDDLAWDLVNAFRPERQPLLEDRPIAAKEEKEAVERWKDYPDGFHNPSFYYLGHSHKPIGSGAIRSRWPSICNLAACGRSA